jgi:uncharacterized protein (UPF0276 family)
MNAYPSAGVGLRAAHHDFFSSEPNRVEWLEVHSENYFAEQGLAREILKRIRQNHEISLHGVGLSLGSSDPLDCNHLRKLKSLVRDIEPCFVSEHLSWSSIDGRYLHDLLPVAFTSAAIDLFCEKIDQTQNILGRRILLENISAYIQFSESELDEAAFITEIAARSGAGLLLDINNIYVNSVNHEFDAIEFIDRIPPGLVEELHLAGHSQQTFDAESILVDTHDAPVPWKVWELYEYALARFGRLPTLIEWDAKIPAPDVLLAEANEAQLRMDRIDAAA